MKPLLLVIAVVVILSGYVVEGVGHDRVPKRAKAAAVVSPSAARRHAGRVEMILARTRQGADEDDAVRALLAPLVGHDANTPPLIVGESIMLSPPNTVLRRGDGKR